jgi:hypothetical protein
MFAHAGEAPPGTNGMFFRAGDGAGVVDNGGCVFLRLLIPYPSPWVAIRDGGSALPTMITHARQTSWAA